MTIIAAFCAGVAFGVGSMIWLGLWADARNQRFYIATESRDWGG